MIYHYKSHYVTSHHICQETWPRDNPPHMAHQGEWLRQRVEQSGKSKAQFARKVGLSREHLQRLFKDAILTMRPDTMWRIVDAIGLKAALERRGHQPEKRSKPSREDVFDILRQKYTVEGAFDELIRLDIKGQLPLPPRLTVEELSNVQPFTEERFVPIPQFELAVAAGGWVEIDGVGETLDQKQIEQGLFRIRIRGDSMTSRKKGENCYPDGAIVEFRCIRTGLDGFVEGKDYYVQRDDDTATFKRVEKVDEDEITLRALNTRKYPEPLIVPRGLIVRAGRAVNIVQPVK